MRSEFTHLACPSCAEPLAEQDIPDQPSWQRSPNQSEIDTPRVCGRCGWECVTLGPSVEDDGDADTESGLAVNADGEPTTDPEPDARCPRCARLLDVAEPGVLRCRFCRRTAEFVESPLRGLVEAVNGRNPDWPADEFDIPDYEYGDEDEYDQFDPCCPNGCVDDHGGGAAPVDALADGYVLCTQCGEPFRHPQLFEHALGEWAEYHDEPRNRPRVRVDPAGRVRTLAEACRRVQPGGVVRLPAGEYDPPDALQAHDITLEGRGAVRAAGLHAMWGRVCAVGVTFTKPVVLHHARGWFVRCRFEKGLEVMGWRSAVRVRRCAGESLAASEAAKVEVFRSRFFAAAVSCGAWASFDRSRLGEVRGDRHTGVFLTRCRAEGVTVGGRGVLTRCRVAAVQATERARVVLRRGEVAAVGRAKSARIRRLVPPSAWGSGEVRELRLPPGGTCT